MSKDETKLNLFEKLAKIRKSVGALQKNKSGYGYKYTTEDEILVRVTAGMDKYGVSLVPMIKPGTGKVVPYQYVDKKGKDAYEIIVSADMIFRWVNDENPQEFLDVDWMLVGQQNDAAQAMGAGLTYTNRYFLLKYFQIATVEDDPDKWRSKKQSAMEIEEQEEVKKAIVEITDLAKARIAEGVDKESVYAAIAAHTANGSKNPNAIKDIPTARKVAEQIKKLEAKKDAE